MSRNHSWARLIVAWGLLAIGAIREVGQDTYTLVERDRYDDRFGLVVGDLSVVMEGLLA